MTIDHPLRPHVDQAKLADRVRVFFDLGEVQDLSFIYGGYMCHNYRMTTDQGIYFLKQYRNKISTIVHEIKYAEEFFSSQGFPVIMPIEDRSGRRAFWVDDHWLSIFPFVDGYVPALREIDMTLVEHVGDMLAHFHKAGLKFPDRHFQPLRLWSRRKFFMEYAELEYELARIASPSELDRQIAVSLQKKAELVRHNSVDLQDIQLPYDCLLHGDFIYPNMFVTPSHEITHVYDFEKAVIGPRAYELARSLIINCFDDGDTEQNYELGRAFLRAYRARLPISFDEFDKGVHLFMINLRHSNWIESRYLIYGIDTQLDLYERHTNRLEWTVRSGEGFSRRVFE
ncbi:hypothetical protein A2348_04835 [Candidatus Uhrbacteria bacterium RIFOXYB12_FULL_58_10]|uniref:Aminoglycoside phosphotransferase domain-containing protein n=1 Tax=Candidatus Uhrbacteria bacterium RIFOXYB2_FULL_57_15 TaxID=1802422 RepID=A0A1F7W835_9BACT|nr:MAG: hypothetical protein A2348_04835 [Candidatus Uhrbacteria bacterium RIFOXYB12_FULL_58_10]OGL98796.1 MAG: hypothetical protein A2304_04860 [Candidatus Uhrbacteria bacterium RIFOXYB2_FULL_57_15]OGL99793.1 MAG: hypothetical protein A2501_04695 [Candidatus Uhrbacteria bacterium RIFOXYC12_FULL_57_11]